MKPVFQIMVFIAGFSLRSVPAVASPDVDHMSDLEVSEYAARMSNVIEEIQNSQLCPVQNTSCVRAEFARHGVSYDDKEPVKKRLVLMLGKVF